MELLAGISTVLLSIVGLMVRAILKGDLVPKQVHDSRIADRDVIIAYLKDANAGLIGATAKFAQSGEATDKLQITLNEQIIERGGRDL